MTSQAMVAMKEEELPKWPQPEEWNDIVFATPRPGRLNWSQYLGAATNYVEPLPWVLLLARVPSKIRRRMRTTAPMSRWRPNSRKRRPSVAPCSLGHYRAVLCAGHPAA
jgi:hypothetical protein